MQLFASTLMTKSQCLNDTSNRDIKQNQTPLKMTSMTNTFETVLRMLAWLLRRQETRVIINWTDLQTAGKPADLTSQPNFLQYNQTHFSKINTATISFILVSLQ